MDLDELQQSLDSIYAALDKNSKVLANNQKALATLTDACVTESIVEEVNQIQVTEPPYWMKYIFPPNSNLLRYKCSICGYISTFKLLSCPRCKETMQNNEQE